MRATEFRTIRKQRFGRQYTLAKVLGVRRATISNWEREAVPIPQPVAVLMTIFDTYPDEAGKWCDKY